MRTPAVVMYFGDDVTRAYQVLQWLPALEILDDRRPVGVVTRDPEVAALVRERTQLAVFVAPSFAEVRDLFAGFDPAVVLYCNNSPRNFDALLESRALHVHVNHGESDKQSMASNNAKSYDRVFVAGQAAVDRHRSSLLELDLTKLVRVGRPQLDVTASASLPASSRRTVLYAPTWEGDAEYNDFTSLDVLGEQIVRELLAVRDARVVYKPHPKILTTNTLSVRVAHERVVDLIGRQAERESAAGHCVAASGDILGVYPQCDLLVADVSAVGLDWLYLRPERPLVLTDRYAEPERLRHDVPVSRCADVVDVDNVGSLSELAMARLDDDEHRLSRAAMRRHYFDDFRVGASLPAFIDAVTGLLEVRDRLLGVVRGASPRQRHTR